eukprot:TRINITY_DN23638_c0_g2_i1.p1 TRINITY_DN23638_c0_g2~~TRINITY_DN23638_c0_g2_i1.p1  ORF type:complete len:600 (-),score=81.05 TRINITY_DN23638_c0_g2_i1:103-1902(-)
MTALPYDDSTSFAKRDCDVGMPSHDTSVYGLSGEPPGLKMHQCHMPSLPMKITSSMNHAPCSTATAGNVANVANEWPVDAMGASVLNVRALPPVASERLQHAADVLQAAIANWTSCMQSENELAHLSKGKEISPSAFEAQTSEHWDGKQDVSEPFPLGEMSTSAVSPSTPSVLTQSVTSMASVAAPVHFQNDLSNLAQLVDMCGGEVAETSEMFIQAGSTSMQYETCFSNHAEFTQTPLPSKLVQATEPSASAFVASQRPASALPDDLMRWMKEYIDRKQGETMHELSLILKSASQNLDSVASAVDAASKQSLGDTALPSFAQGAQEAGGVVATAISTHLSEQIRGRVANSITPTSPVVGDMTPFSAPLSTTPLNKHAAPFITLASSAAPYIPREVRLTMAPKATIHNAAAEHSTSDVCRGFARMDHHHDSSTDNVGQCGGGHGRAAAALAAASAAAAAAGISCGGEDETISSHLRLLRETNQNCVVIVRKINRLGFESPTSLKEHYSKYGTVENVLVSHYRVKSTRSQKRVLSSRLRPSGMGFVVMSRPEEVDLIIADGAHQTVASVNIVVQRFERKSIDQEREDEDCQCDETDRQWQ